MRLPWLTEEIVVISVNLPVIVAASYFVDIYDLVLFSIVRVPSFKFLRFSGQELIDNCV